jgi:hypothetical protein
MSASGVQLCSAPETTRCPGGRGFGSAVPQLNEVGSSAANQIEPIPQVRPQAMPYFKYFSTAPVPRDALQP